MSVSSPRRSMRWILLLVIVGGSIVFGMLHHNRQQWKDCVRTLYAKIDPGMSVEALRATIAKHEWTSDRTEWEDTRVVVHTPMTIGATNWYLAVEWANDTVTAVRIRSADSWELLPPNAPADKTP